MNGYEYILSKQTAWATNSDITLVGSKGKSGRPAYTSKLDQNLFQQLLPDVQKAFAAGDGGELGSTKFPGKMQAVHSSSALGVNVFQYWQSINEAPLIAAQCGLCRQGSRVSSDIHFEEKYPINDTFGYHPNIDVVIHNAPSAKIKRFAVECKFSEAYGAHKHGGLKAKYLDFNDLWADIPNLLG
jgi:Restriction Endonuclease associating with ARP